MILQYWSTIFQSTSDAVIWLRGWPQLCETGLRLGLLVKPGSFTEKQWCLGLHRFKISSKHHHFFQDFWKCGRLLVSFQVRRKKSERSFPSIFPRIFFYHLLIKSVIKVEMEMQFRTLSYTGTGGWLKFFQKETLLMHDILSTVLPGNWIINDHSCLKLGWSLLLRVICYTAVENQYKIHYKNH